jgi:phosphodiesterase/alkaline phosphatase D-like protein
MDVAGYTRCGAKASRKFYKNAFELPHVSAFLAAFSPIAKQSTKLNMKNFVSLRIVTLVLVAGYMLKTTGADADVTFLGVAAGDATTNDVAVWTRAKDEANPQPTAINVQISQDPTFITGVTTLPAGTAGPPTDFTVKSNLGGLELGTFYYYRFQTTNASVTSNVGKFKTAPNPTANIPVHFAFSGDCDGLIRPYALASQVPSKNLDFFMFDGDTEYETSASI